MRVLANCFVGALLCLLAAGAANAQCPTSANQNPDFPTGGQVFHRLAPQWNQYFGSKIDANNGVACGLTLYGSALFSNNLNVQGALTVGGAITFAGLAPGTAAGCLGLTAFNVVVIISPCPTGGGGSVTWPTTGGLVQSTGTDSPSGLFPVNGSVIYGSGGVWIVTPLATLLASPPPIGTTPNTGGFTTLAATGGVHFSGLSLGTQVKCMGLDSGNNIVLTNFACPTSGGGSGTVGSGTDGQLAGYAASGTAVAGVSVSGDITINGHTGVATLPTVNSGPGSTACSSVTTNGKGLVVANSTGTCGATITLSPGLAGVPASYNSGLQTVTNGNTLSEQKFYTAAASPGTVTVASTDGGRLWTATVTGVTFSSPNPGSVGTASFQFGYDGVHSYSLTTVGGSASIYGSCGPSATTLANVTFPTLLVSDGTNYQCVPNGGSNSSIERTSIYTSNTATLTIPAVFNLVEVIRQGTPAALAINLPASPPTNMKVCVKDSGNDFSSNNATVQTTDATQIDGSATYVMNQLHQSKCFLFDSVMWDVVN